MVTLKKNGKVKYQSLEMQNNSTDALKHSNTNYGN